MEQTVLILLLVAAIVWAALAWRHYRRRNERVQMKEQVQTWENEGGNVPEVPTVTPHPQPGNRRG
jgi:hypothetical protein